jgi:uncharacterized membrane protein YbhN (UPF0104 family)
MVVERVLNLGVTITIASVFFVGFALRTDYTFPAELSIPWLLILGIVGLALCGVIGMWAVHSQHRYAVLLRSYTGQACKALYCWRQSPRLLLETVGWCSATFVVGGIGVLLPIVRATGADISLLQAIGCTSAATLLTLIPVAINGIGVYEAGVVGLLAIVGVAEANAAQAAILLRLVMIITAAPGAYWLRFKQAGEYSTN